MNTDLEHQKYGIAGLEKKQLWKEIKKQLKSCGFTLRTNTTLIKDFPETVVMLQLQTSNYATVDYYINIACMVKFLNDNPCPLFDRDRMNYLRIEDKGSLEACIDDIVFYTDNFSSTEKLRKITLDNQYLYNMSAPKLLKYLGI